VPAWVWAGAGVIALLGLGLESLRLAFDAVLTQWNVLLFILGLMGISAAAEYSGLFEWIASALLERASGSRKLLFVNLFIAGSVMTIFFSNDATAIVFTPIICRTVAKRGIDALPYLYACTFVADTASFGLPFSNPTNLLVLPRPNFIPFLLHLGPPMLISLVINLAVFLLMFRTRLRGHYVVEPTRAIERRQRYTLAAMVAVAAAYVVALALRWPLGPVAVIGALFVLVAGKVYPREASQRIGWSTFPLLAGLFVLLDAVSRSGFTTWAISGLHRMAHEGAARNDLGRRLWVGAGSKSFQQLANRCHFWHCGLARERKLARVPVDRRRRPRAQSHDDWVACDDSVVVDPAQSRADHQPPRILAPGSNRRPGDAHGDVALALVNRVGGTDGDTCNLPRWRCGR